MTVQAWKIYEKIDRAISGLEWILGDVDEALDETDNKDSIKSTLLDIEEEAGNILEELKEARRLLDHTLKE